MRVLRATVTAVLIFTAATSAVGQCISEARVISTRRSVPNLVVGPIAFGNGILAVAKFDRSEERIFVTTYDQNFNQLSSDLLIASDSSQGALRLLWNGAEFALFYRDDDLDRLVLQHITMSGQASGAPIFVSPRTFDHRDQMDATWSSFHRAYVVASTDRAVPIRDVWVTVITPTGAVQRDVNTSAFTAYDDAELNALAADDGTIAVFYSAADESIVWTRLGPTGALVYQMWTAGRNFRAVALGNRFYLVKQVPGPEGTTQIRWMAVNTDGQVVEPDSLLVEPIGIDVLPLSLITNGEELALSYVDYDLGALLSPPRLRLRQFTTDGSTISDSFFAVDPLQITAFGEHDFVWTGSAYVTSAVYERDRELNSLLIRICPLRAHVTGPAMVMRNELVTFNAAPEGGTPGYTYAWNSGDSVQTFTGPTFRYRYREAGTYTVTLTVTDQAGVRATTTFTVQVMARKRRSTRH